MGMNSYPEVWERISAYLAENKRITALEVGVDESQNMVVKAVNNQSKHGLKGQETALESRRLDCIYDEEPLGFEKEPSISLQKMQAQDPLEEINLGGEACKRPTYISTKVGPSMKAKLVQILKEYKDCFAWDYNEMPGLSREVVEHRLPIRPGKKPV